VDQLGAAGEKSSFSKKIIRCFNSIFKDAAEKSSTVLSDREF
jgi:hypothetical protein